MDSDVARLSCMEMSADHSLSTFRTSRLRAAIPKCTRFSAVQLLREHAPFAWSSGKTRALTVPLRHAECSIGRRSELMILKDEERFAARF